MAEGKQFRDAGHFTEAIQSYARAAAIARNEKDAAREARSLVLMSAAQGLCFQYSAALSSSRLALEAAAKTQNPSLLGSANNNISVVYGQLGDLESAESAANEAVANFRLAENQPKVKDSLARALTNRASIYFLENRNADGYRDSGEALALGTATGNLPLQALVWEARGTMLMRESNVAEAQKAFEKEYAIRQKLSDSDGLAITKEHLAELELKKTTPDCGLALRLIDEAFASQSVAFKMNAQYYPIHIRAKILLQSGEKTKALAEFRRAVVAADQWRLGALPGDLTNTQTVASLQDVYADYAQLAAEISLDTNNRPLANEALEVLAENRASSLRDQIRLVRSRNLQFPDSYYLKLSQLQSAQAQVTLGQNTKEDKLQLQRIRAQIADLENQIGIKPEKFRTDKEKIPRRNSLKDIQAALNRDQALLSISLGKNKSFLWVVTGDKVQLAQIAKESELKSAADAFSSAVRSSHNWQASADLLGRKLFGSVPSQVWRKPEWLLVSDGPLLSGVPFCALPDLSVEKYRPLIAGHAVRFLPSELLLLSPKSTAAGREFLGIGDPIYNQADSRIVRNPSADAKTISQGAALARLVGGDQEVRSAARESHSPATTLLMGARATRDDVQTAIQAQPPEFIHFAVHVVSPPDQPQQAALALSLRNGIPELLTPEVIGSFQVPGSLVVMSGCSSDQGRALPGAGLVGLSRAWLVAGASSVVVSSWPTPDDSGQFFASFYRQFDQIKSGSIAQRAALALSRTQSDMLNGSGYRTSPAFWGAFAIISKE